MSRVPSEHRLRVATAVLAVIGLAIATYVAIAEFGGGTPVCVVGGGGGCKTVAQSEYSHLAGINVAVLGIAGYVSLLAASALRGDPGRFAGLLFSLIGFGFSAYLTYLELFVIDAICQWCVGSAIVMTLLLTVNAVRAVGYAGRAESRAPADG